MINRRKFLTLVRNRVAAGVLCSGMLTDALTGTTTGSFITDGGLAFPRVIHTGKITTSAFSHLLRPGLKKDFEDAYKDFEDGFTHIMFIEPGDIGNTVMEITDANNPST